MKRGVSTLMVEETPRLEREGRVVTPPRATTLTPPLDSELVAGRTASESEIRIPAFGSR
jgi:hypothetical protein